MLCHWLFILLWTIVSSHEVGEEDHENCGPGTNYIAPTENGTVLDPCDDGPCWTYCDHKEWHETEYNASEFSEEHLKEEQYECLSSACTNFFYGHVNVQVLEECAHYKCLVMPKVIEKSRHCTLILIQGSNIYAALEDYKVRIDRYARGNRSLVEYGKHNFLYRVNNILSEQYNSNNKLDLTVHDMNTLLEETDPDHEENQVDVILKGLEESVAESREINERIKNATEITEEVRKNLHLIRRQVKVSQTLVETLKVVKEYLDQVRLDILQIYVYDTDICTSIPSLVADIEGVCDVCANGKCKFDHNLTTFKCACDFGWVGEYCDIAIKSCEDKPCLNQGECFDEDGDFRCECPSAWVGQYCDLPVIEENQCILGPSHPCQNNAICVNVTNTRPSYECTCDFGWIGRNCQHVQKDCSVGNPCDNGQCNFNGSRLECVCPEEPIYKQPFFVGPTCSTEQKECDYDQEGLDKGIAINGLPCSGHGLCELDVGTSGYSCVCESSHIGLRCSLPVSEQNKCALYEIPCVNGDCQNCNSAQDCTCTCNPGFEGEDCSEKFNPCSEEPCLNNATCIPNSAEDYYCDCTQLSGAYGGKNCGQTVTCADKPCGNNFISCNDKTPDGSIECICESPWVGDRCEKKIDVCDETSCLNGGNCIQGMVGFCQCVNGYTGSRCQVPPAFCKNNPCGSYGKCQLSGNSFICICDAGWEGELCNTDIDDCDPNPCRNNGTCVDKINNFICLCEDEWRGVLCEIKRSSCDNIECTNKGTCVDTRDEDWTPNDYECKCPSATCKRELILGSGKNAIRINTTIKKREISYWLLVTGCAAGFLAAMVLGGLYWYSRHSGRKPRSTNKFIMMDMVN